MRLIFLDRDGVINHDSPDFVRDVSAWLPIPGSLEAIAALSAAGWRVVVVTNQSGLARGLIDAASLDAIHARMIEEIERRGGRLAGIEVCPHAPEAGCGCRKPRPGLIERGARALGLDPRGAPLVGDRLSDLQAARAAGCRPIWVASGAGRESQVGDGWQEVPRHPDLASVVSELLGTSRDR